jgi:dipeptidyl aminopeptidase/acylaminoacyl peptidase
MRNQATLLIATIGTLLLPLVSSAQTAAKRPMTFPAKRPMTFQDMMKMRRLGETDVSPDGKWLLYSVTDVDLAANTRTPKIWIQTIESTAEPRVVSVTKPGDGGARFSHDGKHILFLSNRLGTQLVYVADFDPNTGETSNAANPTLDRLYHANTLSEQAALLDEDNAIWSPDGQSIVFTAQVYPDCPAISADNQAAAKCTMDRDAEQATSKVKARIFTHLLYRHWNAFTGDKRSHLFMMDVATGKLRDLTPNDPHDVPPFSLEGGCGCAFSPDSKELAFTENPDPEPAISTSAQIYTLDMTNPAAKPVKISTSAGGNFNPAYSPDGKYLAWRSQARAGYESDRFQLVAYERRSKTIRNVLQDFPKFNNWVDEFSWIDDSHMIFISGETGEAPVYEVNVTGDDLKRSGKVYGEWSSVHLVLRNGFPYFLGTLMRVDQPSEVVIANALKALDNAVTVPVNTQPTAPTQPGEHTTVIAINKNSSQERTLDIAEPVTHLNDTILAQLDLPKMESFWFLAPDGTKIQGFLIHPPNFDPSKKYPVKFLIHGGPQGAWGDAWSYRWNAELFAANGYVVVMINPGGSTGYGQAFVDRVNGDWGGKPFTDLMTGLDYAEQHYPFIDKTRECALGASYGGYMANWILGHTNRFKCIVSHDGMFNAESAFGSTEEDWFNIWEFKTPNTNEGHPWDYYGKSDSENAFRKWSPSLSAKSFKTPTLVIHSQLDYRLDVSEGFQLFDTLQLLHVPSKMLYFPDEGHWVQKPQNSQLWYKTVNDWVDQWIGDGVKSETGQK